MKPGRNAHAFRTSSPLRRTALVVEDEWLVRAEIADALAASGWTVMETASGEEAIETLEKGTAVSLLVTDIRLIGTVDGWDVADAFRAIRPEGLIIYASANPALSERLAPGSVFVDKPTRISDLVSLCEALWQAAAGS